MVECRAAFPNLDKVQDRLVLRVAGLTMQAHRLVNGKHSRKTIAFVKACLAYCHITIPSWGRKEARWGPTEVLPGHHKRCMILFGAVLVYESDRGLSEL